VDWRLKASLPAAREQSRETLPSRLRNKESPVPGLVLDAFSSGDDDEREADIDKRNLA